MVMHQPVEEVFKSRFVGSGPGSKLHIPSSPYPPVLCDASTNVVRCSIAASADVPLVAQQAMGHFPCPAVWVASQVLLSGKRLVISEHEL